MQFGRRAAFLQTEKAVCANRGQRRQLLEAYAAPAVDGIEFGVFQARFPGPDEADTRCAIPLQPHLPLCRLRFVRTQVGHRSVEARAEVQRQAHQRAVKVILRQYLAPCHRAAYARYAGHQLLQLRLHFRQNGCATCSQRAGEADELQRIAETLFCP